MPNNITTAEALTAFAVTILVDGREVATLGVEAADEWKARTRAIASYLNSGKPVTFESGSHLEYTVTADPYAALTAALSFADVEHVVEHTGGGVMAVTVPAVRNGVAGTVVASHEYPGWFVGFYPGTSWNDGESDPVEVDVEYTCQACGTAVEWSPADEAWAADRGNLICSGEDDDAVPHVVLASLPAVVAAVAEVADTAGPCGVTCVQTPHAAEPRVLTCNRPAGHAPADAHQQRTADGTVSLLTWWRA